MLAARNALLGLLICVLLPGAAVAEVYQFAAATQTADGQPATAYVWVPPEAERIRGVLLAGAATSAEPELCAAPEIRAVCRLHGLAIVYITPHPSAVFDRTRGDPERAVQQALDAAAQASGYPELAVAPVLPIGHSVSTVFASRLAATQPARCFGVILHKGGIAIPDEAAEAALAGVPILAIKGQYEEFGPGPNGVLRAHEDRTTAWRTMRDRLVAMRARNDRALVSLLVEPGATHFAWSDFAAPIIAQFIAAAAERRIGAWPATATQPVKCQDLDPASGALTAADLERPGAPPAAAYRQFASQPAAGLWHLTPALAQAADAFHAPLHSRRPQYVTFADPASGRPILPGHDLRLRFALSWVGPDTFRAAGTFLDAPPAKYPPASQPAGHADGAVGLKVYGGQVEQVGADQFRVRADPRRKREANLLAWHPGDATYAYAEQAAILKLPAALAVGRRQQITFPPAGPLRVGGPPVRLAATSDAGLPVRYYVDHGPAVVEGDTLRLADVPARSAGPLTVVVVAWQFGSAVEPLVQSAEPVRQTIVVEK